MIIHEQVPAYVDVWWNGSLAQYVAALVHSRLPFGIGVAALVWFVLFVVNFIVARQITLANEAQTAVISEGRALLHRGLLPRWVLLQFTVAMIVFAASSVFDRSAIAFFAGGQLVLVSSILAYNVESLRSVRLLAHANAVEGQIKISTATMYRQVANRLLGATVFCALLGLLIAHLTPLGGALWLGATSTGYFRRARQADARAKAAS